MMRNAISIEKFLTGMKYGLIVEVILGIVLATAWWIWIGTIISFPIGLYTFAFGGIYFTVAGCIGPGRYQKEYKILLYTPEIGSSFSDTITVSGFTLDPEISEVAIVVNGKEVSRMRFDERGLGQEEINRGDFIYETINNIYLEAENHTSNVNTFTLFEYTDDMTDEEIDELAEMETKPPVKSLKDAKVSYTEKTSGRIGSIAVGLGALGLLNFLFGIVLDLFGILY